MSRIVIGLNGLPGTGKDTIAGHLFRHHGFVQLAFADAVKAELSEAFGVPVSVFNARHLKTTPLDSLAVTNCRNLAFTSWFIGHVSVDTTAPMTPRLIMQCWGTGFRRGQDDNYWLKRLMGKVDSIPSDVPLVISDVRFDNELRLVKDLIGKSEVWSVSRPNNPHHSKADRHISNQALSGIDRVILNAGTVRQLEHKVDRALKSMQKQVDTV